MGKLFISKELEERIFEYFNHKEMTSEEIAIFNLI
jgi:hypothetical protein